MTWPGGAADELQRRVILDWDRPLTQRENDWAGHLASQYATSRLIHDGLADVAEWGALDLKDQP